MAFLHDFDYETHITLSHLNQVIDNDLERLDKAERIAIGNMKSVLRGKFDLTETFPEVNQYDGGTTYQAGDGVFFDDGNGKKVYTALQETTGNDPTDTTYWEQKDPRNPVILDLAIMLTICVIMKRVSPKAIPQFRQKDCDEAKKHLHQIADGAVDPGLVELVDDNNIKPIIRSSNARNWFY